MKFFTQMHVEKTIAENNLPNFLQHQNNNVMNTLLSSFSDIFPKVENRKQP